MIEKQLDNMYWKGMKSKKKTATQVSNELCSPLTCSFSTQITQLEKHIKKLENDMKLCKEHYEKLLDDRD